MTDRIDIEESRSKIKKAHEKVAALCAGRERWTMRIPADQRYDHDLVIDDGLCSGEKALDELEAARERIADQARLINKYAQLNQPILDAYFENEDEIGCKLDRSIPKAVADWIPKVIAERDRLRSKLIEFEAASRATTYWYEGSGGQADPPVGSSDKLDQAVQLLRDAMRGESE